MTTKASINSPQIAAPLSAINSIIVVPLLISFIFVFSLLSMQAHSAANITNARQHRPAFSTINQADLPLVTQPNNPSLTTAADDTVNNSDMQADGTVGPSSDDAAGYLQNAPKGSDLKGNDGLQATRKTLKLDDLSL